MDPPRGLGLTARSRSSFAATLGGPASEMHRLDSPLRAGLARFGLFAWSAETLSL